MKNLEEKLFDYLVEYRTKKKSTEEGEDIVMNQGKQIVDIDLDKVEGKPAKSNGTKDLWGVDEPTNDDAARYADKKEFDHNMRKLYKKFQAEDDFFIIGRAGWAKTAIIKKMAKKFGRTILTVYLDKAMKEDLAGIPVPQKSKKGSAYQEMAIPGWAAYMLEHPEKKFLLFFDEMNQADPGVMNALMPIVLNKEIAGHVYDNFIVGAAGNFESENGSVNELSGPLRSRFMPIIEWETNTEDTWKSTFKYLHGEWDGKIGPDLVNKFEENAMLFENPRELELKIFKSLYKIKQTGDVDWYDSTDFYDDLVQFVKEETRAELDRKTKQVLQQLAEDMVKWLNSKTNTIETKGGRRSKNKEMIDPEIQGIIEDGIKYGYFTLEETKYGVSEEDIFDIFAGTGEDDLNAEQVQRIINTLEGKGITFKYKTKKDYKKDGYTEYKD